MTFQRRQAVVYEGLGPADPDGCRPLVRCGAVVVDVPTHLPDVVYGSDYLIRTPYGIVNCSADCLEGL